MNSSSSQPSSGGPASGMSAGTSEMLPDSAATCSVRVYAELNDSLPAERRYHSFSHVFPDNPCVADIASNLGINPDSIDLVLLNGTSAGMTDTVGDGDRLSLYPVFESLDVTSVTKVRSRPLRTIRFVLDVHLGKLAYYLRMFGFDTVYRSTFRDNDLLELSLAGGRTLLSKDKELLSDVRIQRGYRVREKHPREQLLEVLERFDLFGSCAPLERCIRCNVLLESVEKQTVLDFLPPRVVDAFHEFRQCPECDRVYWKGSHYERMTTFIDGILSRH